MAEQRVVDTNVVSLSLKEPSTPDALAYEPHLVGHELVISFVTLVELLSWPILRGWGQPRARRLEAHVFGNFAIYYADEVGLCQSRCSGACGRGKGVMSRARVPAFRHRTR